jgi:predicted O-methyltransferase YrrM
MITFNRKINAVLKTYHQRIAEEDLILHNIPRDIGMARRDEFLLSVGQEIAIFLNTLVKAAKAKTILEIGTSYGYSTIFLAEAAKATGGHVITLENDPKKAAYAQAQMKAAGLSDFVTYKVGDALETIANSEETFDFVLLDIWKELYVPCFEAFLPKINKNAFVIADNMIFPPHSRPEAEAYRTRVRETNAFDTVLLPMGSGVEVSRKL